MDLLEISESELKKLKIKELKKLITEQKLFEIKKTDKKKDLLKKINEVKKEYEDSDSEESVEPKVEEIIENIEDLNLNTKKVEKKLKEKTNKFEKKDETQNYMIFNNNILYDICQILKELVDHCLIKFNEDGFKIRMVDKNLVTLVNIDIKDYDSCNFVDGEYQIVINIVELLKILDCKESNQKIKFLFTPDFLEIFFYTDNESYDKFKLHLLDENLVDKLNEFNLEFYNKIMFDSKYFSKMCNKIKKFDDKINIHITNNNIKLSSKNKQIEINDNLEYETNDLDTILLLKYVTVFCKTDKITSELDILYSDDNSPIKFLYKYKDSIIEYIITPQNDDD